jgi:CheY-like chemotaxis protein
MSDEKGNLILIAEDDSLQRKTIVPALEEYGLLVRPVGSESGFNAEVGILGMRGQLPLRLAVIDLMMVDERRPLIEVDASQKRIDHLRDASKSMRCDLAGWRCYDHLRASEKAARAQPPTPVIIYSVLPLEHSREYLEGLRGGRGMYRSIDKNSDPSRIQYVEKGMTHDELHAAVRRALRL